MCVCVRARARAPLLPPTVLPPEGSGEKQSNLTYENTGKMHTDLHSTVLLISLDGSTDLHSTLLLLSLNSSTAMENLKGPEDCEDVNAKPKTLNAKR